MSEYQKYLDCEHIWCLMTDEDVQPQSCTRCGISTDAWCWVQKYVALEGQRDELLAVGQKLCREVERTNEVGRTIRMLDSKLADAIYEMCCAIVIAKVRGDE